MYITFIPQETSGLQLASVKIIFVCLHGTNSNSITEFTRTAVLQASQKQKVNFYSC